MSKKNRRNQSKRAAFTPVARPVEFNPDYSQVKRDLRRIGILAGLFFILLIALALVQHFHPLF